MNEMMVSQSLTSVWLRAIKEGKIVNEFEVPDHGKLQIGLRIKDGAPEYFAKDSDGNDCSAKVEERQIDGGFWIQFNGYRAFKPSSKISKMGAQDSIPRGQFSCRFLCKYPERPLSVASRESLASIDLGNFRWNAYYNAAPFEENGHFLWLPTSTDKASGLLLPHFPQELTLPFLEDMRTLKLASKHLVIFFNALHAGASVDHIHIQAVFHKYRLAIESAPIEKQNGKTVLANYPAHVFVYDLENPIDAVWQHIETLQNDDVPFNLVFIGDRICLIPRNLQHEVVEEFPMGILASMEFAGKIVTADWCVYKTMDLATIQTAFKKTTIPHR